MTIQPTGKRLWLREAAVEIPAIGDFSVNEHFNVDNADGVPISWWGDRKVLLSNNIIETGVSATTLRVHGLNHEVMGDDLIIEELGGEEVAVVTFGQIWELLKKQKRGQYGVLDNRLMSPRFFVRINGVINVLCVHWILEHGTGWGTAGFHEKSRSSHYHPDLCTFVSH